MRALGKTIQKGFRTSKKVNDKLEEEAKNQGVSVSKLVHQILKEKYFSKKSQIVDLPDKLYCPTSDRFFQIETLLLDGACKNCPYSWKSFDDGTHRAKEKRIKCPMWYAFGNFSYPPRETLARRR